MRFSQSIYEPLAEMQLKAAMVSWLFFIRMLVWFAKSITSWNGDIICGK